MLLRLLFLIASFIAVSCRHTATNRTIDVSHGKVDDSLNASAEEREIKSRPDSRPIKPDGYLLGLEIQQATLVSNGETKKFDLKDFDFDYCDMWSQFGYNAFDFYFLRNELRTKENPTIHLAITKFKDFFMAGDKFSTKPVNDFSIKSAFASIDPPAVHLANIVSEKNNDCNVAITDAIELSRHITPPILGPVSEFKTSERTEISYYVGGTITCDQFEFREVPKEPTKIISFAGKFGCEMDVFKYKKAMPTSYFDELTGTEWRYLGSSTWENAKKLCPEGFHIPRPEEIANAQEGLRKSSIGAAITYNPLEGEIWVDYKGPISIPYGFELFEPYNSPADLSGFGNGPYITAAVCVKKQSPD